MAWVGTGAVWTVSSGILKGSPLGQPAGAAMMPHDGALRFVQISDSHIGFDKPANTDVTGTLRAAVAKIKAAPEPPSFVLHTGDLTHLSRPAEFDTLQEVKPAPGTATSPGPMKVADDRLRTLLGLSRMSFHAVNHPIAITDVPLDSRMETAGGHEVVMDNFSFTPVTFSIPAGTTVMWTNRDDVPHNVVSTDQTFKSPVLDTDERFSHAFDAPGTYPYFCSIHPKMTGRIVVG